jgi:glycosyltransferase involved in cell wall biosynthesis
MTKPLVSTIIPTYNRAKLLRQAVASVIAQTWRPIEIIVVDDGSTDGTQEMLVGLCAANPGLIRVISQSNAGAGRARQAGLLQASGEFIQFLDSDDLLLPRKFEVQVEGLTADTAAGISYGPTLADDETTGIQEITHGTAKRERELMPGILNERLWPTLTPLYRRSVCEAIGPWSDLRVYEDWDYDCRAGLLGVKLHYCEETIAIVRHHWGERAGRAWLKDEAAMRDRITAYQNIGRYALRGPVPREAPERRLLVRSLFWMAREAGARGLVGESKTLYQLAGDNAIDPGWDYRLFGWATRLIGWRGVSGLTQMLQGWRK